MLPSRRENLNAKCCIFCSVLLEEFHEFVMKMFWSKHRLCGNTVLGVVYFLNCTNIHLCGYNQPKIQDIHFTWTLNQSRTGMMVCNTRYSYMPIMILTKMLATHVLSNALVSLPLLLCEWRNIWAILLIYSEMI